MVLTFGGYSADGSEPSASMRLPPGKHRLPRPGENRMLIPPLGPTTFSKSSMLCVEARYLPKCLIES